VVGLSLFICTIATLLSPEPEKNVSEVVAQRSIREWLSQFVAEPFRKFAHQHKNWVWIIIFAMTYKFGDSLMSKMVNPFYVQMGFTRIQVAEITKFFGFAMTVIGGIMGGWAVYKFGVRRTLVAFGILQALSIYSFVWVAQGGYNFQPDTFIDTGIQCLGHLSINNNVFRLTIAIMIDNVCAAMGTAAFTAYLSSLCNVRYTATQYALLTSFMSLGRWMTNAPAGWMVDKTTGLGMSWETFFIVSIFVSIPGLILIKFLKINENISQDKQLAH
jgi:PAT family beta-lactamase induction signal transducer AmpG